MQKSFFSNEVRESAVRIAKVQKNHLAADIGSGTGFITEELIKSGLKVIAVDQSVEMINIMKTRFAGNTNIDLRVGNA